MAPAILESVSLLYVGLPWVVFAAGWLRPVPAACLIGLLLLTVVVELRGNSKFQIPNSRGSAPAWNLESGIWNSLFVVLLAATWTTLSGVGGWTFQNLDWFKHNLLLHDLIEERWPVDYTVVRPSGSRMLPLTYYLAYYLPAAAVGKRWGWEAANHALFVYTLLGVLLALLWFAALTRRSMLRSVLLFPVLSGLDVVGRALWSDEGILQAGDIEWWAGLGTYQYSSNSTLLFWVPQHALAGWILTGLVVQRARDENRTRFALLSVALATLWSPFVALGLAPFALAAVAICGWRSALSFPNLVTAPALALVAGLFLASRNDPVPHGWWFAQPGALARWPKLASFYVLEMGVVALLSRPNRLQSARERAWWWITVGILSALPLHWIGRFNDFTMRVSIPALFVLWSFVAGALQDRTRAMRRIALVGAVCVGAFTPAYGILRGLLKYDEWGIRGVDARPMLAQDPLYRFYVGDAESWFFRHLARPLRQVVTVEAEHPRRAERAIRSEPSGEASNGRVLVLDRQAEVGLTYGFELERPIVATTLIARYRTQQATSIDLSIDGRSQGRLSLMPGSGEWRFADTKLPGELGAGWHELGVQGLVARCELDVFVLVESER